MVPQQGTYQKPYVVPAAGMNTTWSIGSTLSGSITTTQSAPVTYTLDATAFKGTLQQELAYEEAMKILKGEG